MISTHSLNTHRQSLISGYSPNVASARVGVRVNEGLEAEKSRNISYDSSIKPADQEKIVAGSRKGRGTEIFPEQLEKFLQNRTLIDKMVESMGAISSDQSASGRFLDIYI